MYESKGPSNIESTAICFGGYENSKIRLITYLEASNLISYKNQTLYGTPYITEGGFSDEIRSNLTIIDDEYDQYGNYLGKEEQYWATTSDFCQSPLSNTPCVVKTSFGVGGFSQFYYTPQYVRPVVVISYK